MDPPALRIRRGINRIQDLPPGEYVEFNKFGQAVGKWQFLFVKYVGTRTRRLISILQKNWKDVKKEEKNFLWADIKAHFRLEDNDDVRNRTLVSCGLKWKAFKTKLRVHFMLKNKSPLTKWTHIEPAVWDQFCKNENTAAKNKLREIARARQQKQISRPRLGPKGYRGFEKQWEEERNDPDKATELHLIPDLRSSNFCLARAPRDKAGIKPLPAELIDVSNKLVKAASELSESSNESKSGVDPLIKVFGPEHGGRTRGVGCDIGYNKGVEGYVRKKRTLVDKEEIRNEVRQQMQEELKSSDFWLEMRAELEKELRNKILAEHNLSPREDDPRSVELKSSHNSTTNMVRNESQPQLNESFSLRQDDRGLELSSTNSILRKEQQGELNPSSSNKPVGVSTPVFKIQCIKEETYGCLYIPSSAKAGQQVMCATAKIYPIFGNDTVHFQKLKKGHMKVAVLKVMDKHKNMELPVPDDELTYLESAVNGFIQWPIFAIGRYKGTSKQPETEFPTKRLMPQHESAPSSKKGKVNDTHKQPNKKDKESENTSNKQESIQRVENEKDATRKRLQDLENGILTKPQSVIDGYNKWMSREDIAEPYSIFVHKKVFRQTDDFYYSLNATDIIELLTYKELELGILTLFAMSLYQLKDHSKTNKVDFLNPMMITADACFQSKFATMDYLSQSLTGYDFYLAPFLQGRHYVLLIICPKDGKGFILNPQKDAQTNENCYRLAGLVNSVLGCLEWDFPLVNHQPKDWECGYYVMKWMHDFVLKYQNDNFPKTVPWNNERALDTKELNAIIGAWFTIWRQVEE